MPTPPDYAPAPVPTLQQPAPAPTPTLQQPPPAPTASLHQQPAGNPYLKEQQAVNPYAAPQTSPSQATFKPHGTYAGIGRLPYFGIVVGIGLVFIVVFSFVLGTLGPEGSGALLPFLLLAHTGVSLVPVYFRLMNIGMSPWLCLLTLVPIINIFIGIRCLIYPEGWEDHRQFDTAAKVISWVLGGILLLFVILMVLGAMMG